MKHKIRKELYSKRSAIPSALARQKSKIICDRLIRTHDYWASKTILFYLPFKNEVSTLDAISYTKHHLKQVFLPCIEDEEIFARIFQPHRLKPGKFGIPEPDKKCKKIPAKKIDLVIIPGIAFDKSGGRIGYGKGYYDKFLKNIPRVKKVALAYDFQVVSHFKKDSHDVHVDKIITEKRIINCEKNRKK